MTNTKWLEELHKRLQARGIGINVPFNLVQSQHNEVSDLQNYSLIELEELNNPSLRIQTDERRVQRWVDAFTAEGNKAKYLGSGSLDVSLGDVEGIVATLNISRGINTAPEFRDGKPFAVGHAFIEYYKTSRDGSAESLCTRADFGRDFAILSGDPAQTYERPSNVGRNWGVMQLLKMANENIFDNYQLYRDVPAALDNVVEIAVKLRERAKE